MKRSDVPAKCQARYRKAMSGRSQKAAIVTYCLACCRWKLTEVKRCVCPGCPLYFFRLGRGPRRQAEPVRDVPTDQKYADGVGKCRDVYEKALRGQSRRAAVRAACLLCASWDAAAVRNCPKRGCSLWLYRLTGAKGPTSQDAVSTPEPPSPEAFSEAIAVGA